MSSGIHHNQERYLNCTRCGLAESRRHIVFGGYGKCSKGTVERDGSLLYYQGEIQEGNEEPILGPLRSSPTLLFLGEAPGKTEDLTGSPFMGRTGRVLNFCLSWTRTSFHFKVTNILGCRPWKEGKTKPVNRPPSRSEIEACLPRVKDLYTSFPFDGVVYLGAVARDAFPCKSSLFLKHPSAILKQEYKVYDIREFSLKLDSYVNSLCQTELRSTNGGRTLS